MSFTIAAAVVVCIPPPRFTLGLLDVLVGCANDSCSIAGGENTVSKPEVAPKVVEGGVLGWKNDDCVGGGGLNVSVAAAAASFFFC